MLSFCGDEEVFFDTTDHLMLKESSDYDIWLAEPQSVVERRNNFLSRMGFSDESEATIDVTLLSQRRKSNSEANCSVDYSDQDDWLDSISIDSMNETRTSVAHCEEKNQFQAVGEMENQAISKKKKKVMSWWRSFIKKKKTNPCPNVFKKMIRIRIEQNRKKWMECSAIYAGQVVRAHDGLILTMKFSPDGRYLATGGEDGVVCIWHLTKVDASCPEPIHKTNKSSHASVVIPDKTFHIEELPLQRLKGHTGDVLDLAWSTSNYLLSASADKTIRLWQMESDNCLGVFHHSNYVTCVQFNPADENHFISGCIDGKVRIWGVCSKRVEEWTNVQEIVTAVCYQPNGKGFVVGCLSGKCRFYESLGDEFILNAEINFQGRKKSPGSKITGIQFLTNDSRRMMITSEDSKIRILDSLEVVRKYKGMTKSGCQTSASFTSSGRHIVSVGEDSRVYVWNYDDPSIQTTKHSKSTRSCETFLSEGASVVLTWSDTAMRNDDFVSSTSPTSVLERFSLANWFSMDRGSATWPEEKLPVADQPCIACGDHFHSQQTSNGAWHGSVAWGLVFVTANSDGTIRVFHNYGLPVRG